MDNINRLHAIWHGLTRCGSNKQYITDKDIEVFNRRSSSEGAEFYARGFTSLRSALLRGLETGLLDNELPARFHKRGGTQLPAFLFEAWSAIFSKDGALRDDVDVDAVSCLSQMLAIFGKIEGGHTAKSEIEVQQRFVDNEVEVTLYSNSLAELKRQLAHPSSDNVTAHPYFQMSVALTHAKSLISFILKDANPLDIKPSHGSGASACRTPINKRYDRPRYVQAIDNIWSYSDYYFLGAAHLVDEMLSQEESGSQYKGKPWLHDLKEYEPCAKVILVPKDARGPRLISCEPRETMWIQQGLMSSIVTTLEAHPLTRGQINFTDQTVNQSLAFLGSITQDTSTLDLKDASDMLSMELVRQIFPSNWVSALEACRSAKTEMPDGTLVHLSKHAPMGSATCFPVMALSIWAILTAFTNMDGLLRVYSHFPRKGKKLGSMEKRLAKALSSPVYVYGDDIIVPKKFTSLAYLALNLSGLRVNENKSFEHGFFRESCGKEYYRGVDVTPVRLRCMPGDDIPSRMKTIAFHNNVYSRYGVQPDWLTQLIHEWYPLVPERTTKYHQINRGRLISFTTDSSLIWGERDGIVNNNSLSCVLNVYRAENSNLPKRRHTSNSHSKPSYQREEYRFLTVVPKYTKYNKDRWSQVFRALVNPRACQVFGRDALSKRVSYKYRWVSLH